jgi:hypothetical protein
MKFFAAVPKSPTKARNKHRDVHDPNDWMDVPKEHSGHHKAIQVRTNTELRTRK